MKISIKNRNIIIAILMSVTLMLGAFFGTLFALNPFKVEAQEYNPGVFDPSGYYVLDGVVFYAIKVKNVAGEQSSIDIESSAFTIDEVEYTIDNSEHPTKLTYTEDSIEKIINITGHQFFTINGVEYKFDSETKPSKVLKVDYNYWPTYEKTTTDDIERLAFTIDEVEYTIDSSENPPKLTYTEDSIEKTINITDNQFFTINGVEYKFDSETDPSKVLKVDYNYWPTYKMTTTDGNPDFVTFGETVLLKEGESILICFARQTESVVGDNGYIVDEEEKVSGGVDVLNANVFINGVDQPNDNRNIYKQGGLQEHEIGYIINFDDEEITGKDQSGFLGVADGTGEINNEGLIEFSAEYEVNETSLGGNFSFMFYAFKESTYNRLEDLHDNQSYHFQRPRPEIITEEYVTDPSTVNQFYSESFYYYQDQNLPYLEYDYTRYEIAVVKTIHTTATTYLFSYDIEKNEILYTKKQDLSTAGVHAQNLNPKIVEGTTKARIYFSDLGIYDFSYSPVYFGSGSKTYLDIEKATHPFELTVKSSGELDLNTLNGSALKDRLTIYGTQATYQDISEGRKPFRHEEISADVTGVFVNKTIIISPSRTFKIDDTIYTIDNIENPTKVTCSEEEEEIEVSESGFEIGGENYTIEKDADDDSYYLSTVTTETISISISQSGTFEIDDTIYTIDDISNPTKVTCSEEEEEIEVSESGFEIGGENYTIEKDADDDSYYLSTVTTETISISISQSGTFKIDDTIIYTIDNIENPTKVTYLEAGQQKEITINNKQFVIDGQRYVVDNAGISYYEVTCEFEIASTNQPQVSFLFNSKVLTGTEADGFKVYYSSSLDGNFQLDEASNYTHTSNFTIPGYYYIEMSNQYSQYKTWKGNSVQNSSTTTKKQVYFFQIKDQTPDLGIYQLDKDSDGNVFVPDEPSRVYSGNFANGVYRGSFAKNGVQVYEAAATSVFDSPVTLSVEFRRFNQTDVDLQPIDLNSSASALAEFGIVKHDGYYTFTGDGHYAAKLKFGKSGMTSCLFDIDTEEISGITAYNVELVDDSSYYAATELAKQGVFATTNQAISLLWSPKDSGAKITAKYIRFDMVNNNYKTTMNYDEDDDNIYIINDTWLAADYAVVLSETNPETIYKSATSLLTITSSSVLNLDGLYIFKLEDEAGNVGYYSILVDTSIPTVLQESGGTYKKITGVNNVSDETRVFFGSHKAIAFLFDNKVVNLISETGALNGALENSTKFTEYFTALFENLEEMGAGDAISQDHANNNCFAIVPIRRVTYEVVGGATSTLPQSNINQGYHDLIPIRNTNDRVMDRTYIYKIYDNSNRSNLRPPSRAYSVRVNTDQTGIAVYYKKSNGEKVYLSDIHEGAKTSEDLLSLINYYAPLNVNQLYLTWSNLRHEETLKAYVDLANDGLTCYWYGLVWNPNKRSYEYNQSGTKIELDFSNITIEKERDGENVEIAINLTSLNRTEAGKYEIIREYTYTEEGTAQGLGDDYERVTTTFFVDRTDIISAASTGGAQTGYYSYMTLFDGGKQVDKVFYDSLYQQSQTSNNFVVQTNKLPIGFYIPIAKYGTFYKIEGGIPTSTNLEKDEIQQGQEFEFENLVMFYDLDTAIEAGITETTYSPYGLSVVLESPSGLYYYYTYNSSGYFMLSGYSRDRGETITAVTDYKAFIARNPVTGSTVWETGTYKLTVSAVKNRMAQGGDSQYLQNFKFLFNVVAPTPTYELDAQYPDLDNVEDRRLVVGDSNQYYTNTNQILLRWTEPNNSYMTKVDTAKIQYRYYIGSSATTVTDINVTISGNNREFTINIPSNATRVEVTMVYEVYSGDTEDNYRKYYENGRHQSVRTIIIDKVAPDTSIRTLKDNDETVKNINISLLRESADSRFNKSATTGAYRYYSFVPTNDFVSKLIASLKTNSSTQTKYFYYRPFQEKYTSDSRIYETGLGLDQTAQASNLFSEHYYLSGGWKKVTENTEIDANYLEANFDKEGYYEFIELDLAGNMTVYTIYLTSGKAGGVSTGERLNINFNQKLSSEAIVGSLKIWKEGEDIKSELTELGQGGDTKTNPSTIRINSFDTFNFKNLHFDTYTYNGDKTNSYKYLKLDINGTVYVVTPFCYEQGEVATKVVNSAGNLISLSDLRLSARETEHAVKVYDTLNNEVHNLLIGVANSSARITDVSDAVRIVPDSTIPGGQNLTLIIREQVNAALKFDPNSLVIYEINDSAAFKNQNPSGYGYKKYTRDNGGVNVSEPTSTTTGYETSYYSIEYAEFFESSTFYFAFKDTFGNEYFDYVEYKSNEFENYEYSGSDFTSEMQQSNDILVSRDIAVNFSNLFSVKIAAKINNDATFGEAKKYYEEIDTENQYQQFSLEALSESVTAGYYGGLIKFKIERSSSIPSEILDELKQEHGYKINIDDEGNVVKTSYVTIYNELPEIKITTNDGSDITENFLNEKITQSEPVTISFGTGTDLSDELGITPKVFIRLRGSEADYYEITSPTTIGEAGIYDIYIQNFNANGAMDYVQSYDFVISSLNVIFYNVTKANGDGNIEVVSPTGSVFSYETTIGGFNKTVYVPYHYIVNGDYDIVTNGEKVSYEEEEIGSDSKTNTKIYKIKSTSGTIFETTIAVTVVPSTTNILDSNRLMWYFGTTYMSPSADNYITTPSRELFLTKEDGYDEITLRWNSHFNTSYNKITCYVSSDDGQTWSAVTGVQEGDLTTLTLRKSGTYLFKFVDYAGNTQMFTTAGASGYPSTTTRIAFIRSVIYKINNENSLDNSVYNGEVIVSLPTSMSAYYSAVPTLTAMKNNVEYVPSKDANGNYVFDEAGTYVIYFSVKVKGGTRNLKEDRLTFTVINPNDSRWAFNYTNYNNYTINHIRYNGINISSALRAYALSENEINISAFLEDSLGNKYFNNGLYTIKMTSFDDALGVQTFEFDFWLNDVTPPVTVSLPEGAATTGEIKVSFNEKNLYETIGDCYVIINNTVVAEIDSSSSGLQEVSLSNIRSYYIQVYTNSGKLAYSYRVEIVEPFNTITIILIVVSCIVVAGGALLFFLLRRKMKIR